jgi:hypothetical protein
MNISAVVSVSIAILRRLLVILENSGPKAYRDVWPVLIETRYLNTLCSEFLSFYIDTASFYAT